MNCPNVLKRVQLNIYPPIVFATLLRIYFLLVLHRGEENFIKYCKFDPIFMMTGRIVVRYTT